MSAGRRSSGTRCEVARGQLLSRGAQPHNWLGHQPGEYVANEPGRNNRDDQPGDGHAAGAKEHARARRQSDDQRVAMESIGRRAGVPQHLRYGEHKPFVRHSRSTRGHANRPVGSATSRDLFSPIVEKVRAHMLCFVQVLKILAKLPGSALLVRIYCLVQDCRAQSFPG